MEAVAWRQISLYALVSACLHLLSLNTTRMVSMYAKLFRQMYHGTLATDGPWQALITFQQMLILADREGVVDMTHKAISRETTIPLQIIAQGIEVLEQPDPESRTPDEEGRRILRLSEHRNWGWRITNYAKYRQLQREEDRRAYHREYWHKRKDGSTDTQQTQHTQPNQPIADADADADAILKKATSVADRREQAKELWPRVLAAVQATDLQKAFPPDSDVYRAVSKIGGWRRLGLKHRDLRGQTEQEFLNAFAELV